MSILLALLLMLPNTGNSAKTQYTTVTQDNLLLTVRALLPMCLKDKTCDMITDTIRAGSLKYGFLPKDYNLILALIKQESNGRHVPGRGEWGMLQIVPWELHIMKMVVNYECLSTEKMCSKHPLVTKMTRKGLKPDRWLVRDFLKANARASLFVGIGEMAFWRARYHRVLKYRFWGFRNKGRTYTGFPKKYLQGALFRRHGIDAESHYAFTKRWWYRIKRRMGNNLWCIHHNHGNQIRMDKIGMAYPYAIMKHLRRIKKIQSTLS